MKRRIDPLILTYIKDIIKDLPRLTEEEALQLVPMLRSQDEEIRDCAAELIYGTNWIDMNNTIRTLVGCNIITPVRLIEIIDCLNNMDCVENEYDNKIAQIIYDENTRLHKADQIISNKLC